MTLLRAGERLGELGEIVEVGAVTGATVRLGEKHGVVPARTEGDEVGKPFPQRIGVGQKSVMRGAFEPVAVGEAADRKGRREEGHQAKLRGLGPASQAWLWP